MIQRERSAGWAPSSTGPAIVSEPTATTVVPPGATLRVDPFGSLVIAGGKEL